MRPTAVRVQEGDVYLCCSDGVSDRLSDTMIQQTIESSDIHVINNFSYDYAGE